ncbi:MAG TPA: hypothetical protein VK034_04570 [Enhygromyxa sp.]|nr:hypothetical protein [Enhygromyxa sp.]
MDRQTPRAQPLVRALLIVALVPGCIRAPGEAAVDPAATHEAGDRVTLESRPSAAAAALLPVDAHYRVVLADDTLALAIVSADRRLLGRMQVAPGIGPHDSPAVRIEWEQQDGHTARVEAWSSAGGLRGHAFVGERSAAWRVRHEADGSLAGEGWSRPRRSPATEAELLELRRARAIGADLGELVIELANGGVMEDRRGCELVERVAFAELALELGVRAWTGDDRSRLPKIGFVDDPCPP